MSSRPTILIRPDEHEVVDEAIVALESVPDLFRRGDTLVEIVNDGADEHEVQRAPGTHRLLRLQKARLRELLSKHASWEKRNRDGQYVAAHPAAWAVDAIIARQHWPTLREIDGLLEHPTLRCDGTVLTAPGYDAATRLYVVAQTSYSGPAQPSYGHAQAASEELLDVVRDFPFAAKAGASAWLAGLLTVVLRHAFIGPAPMIVFDANAPGSGKSRLVDLIALISTGRTMPRHAPCGDDKEQRKVITSIALSGDSAVLIDNVVGALGGASLDAALTSDTWQDRLLGTNVTVRLPMRVVFFATGNNLQLVGDLPRRCLYVRLDTPHERPEERSDFKYPDLLAHVRRCRRQLISAALTLVRAYVVAGCPSVGLPPFGSFEGWSLLVRGALVWIGLPDPCSATSEIPSTREREAGALAVIMKALTDPRGITLRELIKRAQQDTDLFDALAELSPPRAGSEALSAGSLGSKLNQIRDRVIGARRIERVGRTSPARWTARTLPAEGACGTGGPTHHGGSAFDGSVSSPPSPTTPTDETYDAAERDAIERDALELNGGPSWTT